ncbi:MAG TPA: DUF1592 domain-containing protein, partial [Polyangia bacterium]
SFDSLPRAAFMGSLIVVFAAVACSSDRHLVGQGHDAAPKSPDTRPSAPTPPQGPASPADANGAMAPADLSSAETTPTLTARPLVISGREVVRRLAVVIWDQPSDPTLIAEADAGTIQTSEDVRRLALRMLDDPRARAGVGRFYRWWLEQDEERMKKDPKTFPQYTSEFQRDMARETELFGVHLTLDINADVPALFETQFSFLNDRLASIYGIPGVVGGEHRKVNFPFDSRSGVLTLPGVLAATSRSHGNSITMRGMFVAHRVMCTEIPPPPPEVPNIEELPPGPMTLRQALAFTVRHPSCQDCHKIVDPFGYPFEGFDAIGRVRASDNGLPVDTSATFGAAHGTLVGHVSGPVEMGLALARARETGPCFVRQWLTYALGEPSITNVARSASPALAEFAAQSKFNLREIIALVVQSDAFLARESLR